MKLREFFNCRMLKLIYHEDFNSKVACRIGGCDGGMCMWSVGSPCSGLRGLRRLLSMETEPVMSYAQCPYCGNTSDVGVCPFCAPVDDLEIVYTAFDIDGNEVELTEEEANELPEEDVMLSYRKREQRYPWERI